MKKTRRAKEIWMRTERYKEDCILTFHSPIGPITIGKRDEYLVFLLFEDRKGDCESNLLKTAEKEIMNYFKGNLREFTVPIRPEGTGYQKKVWRVAMEIPYGEIRTYEWIAEKAGGSPRSAGNALGANPIPIIIPCHRVIRKDGSLGGYSSGTGIKRILIEHERLHLGESVLK